MWKSLATRVLVPVVGSVAGFVIVCCLLLYADMKRSRIEERILHANDVAGVVVKSTRYAMLKADRETLQRIVGNVNEEVLVEHVRIFNKQGVVVFAGKNEELGQEVDKNGEGCLVCHANPTPIQTLGPMEQARRFVTEQGVHVMAVTQAIYNEPECFNAACHYHEAEQVVLGTLDIGLSEEPLERSLATLRRQLLVFGVLVVLLSAGGVIALLQRNLLGHLRSLAMHCEPLLDKPREGPERHNDLALLTRAVKQLEHKAADPGPSPPA